MNAGRILPGGARTVPRHRGSQDGAEAACNEVPATVTNGYDPGMGPGPRNPQDPRLAPRAGIPHPKWRNDQNHEANGDHDAFD